MRLERVLLSGIRSPIGMERSFTAIPAISPATITTLPRRVKLMAQLGIKNYRFSLSWPRLLPDGTGKVNEEGVAFYNQSSMLCSKTASAHSSRSFIGTILRLSKTAARGQIRTALHGSRNMPRSAHAALETALRISSRSMSLSASSALGYGTGAHAPGMVLPASMTIPMSHHVLKGARSGCPRPAHARSGLPHRLCSLRRCVYPCRHE